MIRTCPLGHTCDACLWNIRLRGINPQSGQEIDKEECAISMLPLLLVQQAQQTYQTTAAIESFRNEMVRTNIEIAGMLSSPATMPRLILEGVKKDE